MKPKKLDHIVLVVKELEKSVDFYQEIGFTLIDKIDKELAILKFGNEDTKFLLHPKTEHLDLPTKNAATIYGFESEDVHKLHESFNFKGLEVTEIRDQPWNVKEFYLTDPNNHVFAFFERNHSN